MLQSRLIGIILCASTLSVSCQIQAKSIRPDLQGHWVGEAELCHMLCSFTLINTEKDDNEKMTLQFDSGTWSDNARGPFQYVKGEQYELTDGKSGEGIPFTLQDGKLIALGDVVFHREKVK